VKCTYYCKLFHDKICQMESVKKNFGTAPVFFTAISTILGAILFLRFGYAVGTLGVWGVVGIILLGHLVTVPTALAISEIATNKRVEGGGEYFIISRSFGLNIGATIGMVLYISQAISVAFYIIAFTEAFEFFFNFMKDQVGLALPRQVISIPAMVALAFIIIKRGAGIGVKLLYWVVGVLFISLILFFIGKTDHSAAETFTLWSGEFRNKADFFVVFAIVFPAFTGMTAGVGLSGELKNPSKSIPLGTTLATLSGMIIYFFVVFKLATSASVEDLTNNQLIMSKIAWGGAIVIPLGLAASTISSALGSIIVAPRTLQALAVDKSFPSSRLNRWLSKGRLSDGEPINASLVTATIAMVFVIIGDVNAVAEVISMFFMLSYGSLCLISFLNHFGSSPSYRPYFKSRWYISLLGTVVSVWVMFMINAFYSVGAMLIMTLIYIYINYYNKERKGLETIFSNAIFQLNRNLQVFLQKKSNKKVGIEWRPSAICISEDSFKRDSAFKVLNWISYKYGFGTFIHLIEGYYSKKTYEQSKEEQKRLIEQFDLIDNQVYVDTLISPSYTSAIAQIIQAPGIAGMENNMVIFEYDKHNVESLKAIVDNCSLVSAGQFDVCILSSSAKDINYKGGIHVWIKSSDDENANLMIMLSFIMMGHPDWQRSDIKIFESCKPENVEATKANMEKLVVEGRLPITMKNVEIIKEEEGVNLKTLINEKSAQAGLTIMGFTTSSLKHEQENLFAGYDNLGTILFVDSSDQVDIE